MFSCSVSNEAQYSQNNASLSLSHGACGAVIQPKRMMTQNRQKSQDHLSSIFTLCRVRSPREVLISVGKGEEDYSWRTEGQDLFF